MRPGRGLPVTGFGTLLTDRPAAGPRVGLWAYASHRQKSRASTRVASIPGDLDGPEEPEPSQEVHRIGALRRHRTPDACRSFRNVATAVTGSPAGSRIRTGSHKSPPASTAPVLGTTSVDRSRSSLMDRDRSQLRLSSDGIPPVSGTGSSVNRRRSAQPPPCARSGSRPTRHRYPRALGRSPWWHPSDARPLGAPRRGLRRSRSSSQA